jgi:hypothetical protein
LWQLLSKPAARGGAWFAATGFAKEGHGDAGVLVVMETAPGREIGVAFADVWQHYDPHTVFARETAGAGRPLRFASVLIPVEKTPNGRGLDAGRMKTLADRVRIKRSSTGAVAVDIANTRVELAADDSTGTEAAGNGQRWSVTSLHAAQPKEKGGEPRTPGKPKG